MSRKKAITPKRVYLAGPMRGHKHYNFPAFFEAEESLQGMADNIFNPARYDVEQGFEYLDKDGSDEEIDIQGFNIRKALLADVTYICMEATHIFMLPGWSSSKGATAERALGLALGLTIEGAAS